ncbi:uncharacterized protein LOC112046142 [Bicyclus anynana]|uniref:Uncharacterized protein LOC112046142 n=1 Tax=Bicyclus anynana TaxID=110368 RepID=A0A6J1MV45_BICAN|nr:uncharacterized protein LOC112046142 [Bicyclus anynana]
MVLKLREDDKISPPNLLDKYKKLRSPLTLEERNRMVDLGYEYIGRAIHSMLQNMSPGDTLPVSTRMPFGGNPGKHTPLHQDHEVTSASTEPETIPPHHSTHSGRFI